MSAHGKEKHGRGAGGGGARRIRCLERNLERYMM